MAWREEDDRTILREEDVDLGNRMKRRQVAVVNSDAAEVVVQWGDGEEEPGDYEAVTLEAEDMDELCLWWILRRRPDYRALIRAGGHLEANPWIQSPESFLELLNQREMD